MPKQITFKCASIKHMTFTSRDNAVFVQSLLVYREFRIQREGTLNFFSFPLFVHEQEKKKKTGEGV